MLWITENIWTTLFIITLRYSVSEMNLKKLKKICYGMFWLGNEDWALQQASHRTNMYLHTWALKCSPTEFPPVHWTVTNASQGRKASLSRSVLSVRKSQPSITKVTLHSGIVCIVCTLKIALWKKNYVNLGLYTRNTY